MRDSINLFNFLFSASVCLYFLDRVLDESIDSIFASARAIPFLLSLGLVIITVIALIKADKRS